jgi:hypothetical protein
MTVELLEEHHIVVNSAMTADITSSLLIPKQHALKQLTESNQEATPAHCRYCERNRLDYTSAIYTYLRRNVTENVNGSGQSNFLNEERDGAHKHY